MLDILLAAIEALRTTHNVLTETKQIAACGLVNLCSTQRPSRPSSRERAKWRSLLMAWSLRSPVGDNESPSWHRITKIAPKLTLSVL